MGQNITRSPMLGIKLGKHGMASHVNCHDGSYGHGVMGKDALEYSCIITGKFIILLALVAASTHALLAHLKLTWRRRATVLVL